MDKKLIALLILTASISTPTFAAGIISKLIAPDTKSPVVKSHATSKKYNQSYTDFSGDWTVNCGEGRIDSMKIENDQDWIKVNDENFNIGKGIAGFSNSNEYFIDHEFISFEWDANQTTLVMRETAFSKDNVEDNSPIRTLASITKLSMINDQIILDGMYAKLNDATKEKKSPLHCVFTRNNNQRQN
jgi:hypothetical protein